MPTADPAMIYSMPTADTATSYSLPITDSATLPTTEFTTIYRQLKTEAVTEWPETEVRGGGGGGEDMYEDPDKLVSRSCQRNYEITQCPAYLISTESQEQEEI